MITNLKSIIRKGLRRGLFSAQRIGIPAFRLGTFTPLETIILRFFHADFFFVQIGANDGKTFDPIYGVVNGLKCKGIVIEPIKEYFEELKMNYKHLPNIAFLNCAIYHQNTKIPMFRVDKNRKDLPDFAKGIASTDRNHHKKPYIPIPKEAMVEEEVTAITFDTLLELYRIRRIDLLQIDAEGYDYNILRMINFSRIKPRIVNFEHHLSDGNMSHEQFIECISLLIKKGYRIITQDFDCIAYIP